MEWKKLGLAVAICSIVGKDNHAFAERIDVGTYDDLKSALESCDSGMRNCGLPGMFTFFGKGTLLLHPAH